ncbi:MAG: DUF488 domain-containing protein [Flavobacterium sp.]|jgi:uncharacterized protein (DUF488 family)|uniref:DUF488 domain-containing protein n=1 Tax=Flavobacterium sp. TaxID=239 RepID=UPI0022C38B86|nr:DUF488 domain-containing protein [Flavobacterium sp.]MCZ8090939.1 DUF488 domain-containing protein [Flavobacterium sp.]MCZ8331695.1 DUF488 domain-containing protein [Flavobacterium sp.]
MFYRRKIILALIQLLGGELEKIRIQKLLFLYSQKKKNPEYEFIPYKFGCYSFSAKADLNTMVKNGSLAETENYFIKNNQDDFVKSLKVEDKKIITEVVQLYGNMNSNSLIKHTYINFPYYAINSTIADKVLDEKQLEKVVSSKKESNDTVLFTIGYEGVSLEKYLNKLVSNDVKLLVDVRKNSLSMKFGFSKSLLKKYCESLGIEYIHIPEVGINSDQRQELNTQQDYDALFEVYKKTTLKETDSYQAKIIELLTKYKRIALTCFEADICQCHRKPLAEAIAKNPIFEYEVKHI